MAVSGNVVKTSAVAVGLAGWAFVIAGGMLLRYRREIQAASARIATVDRRLIRTEFGSLEYCERGSGERAPQRNRNALGRSSAGRHGAVLSRRTGAK